MKILEYHQRTKHHLDRFARGPGHLDWETQPDPFRTYALAPRVDLPLVADTVTTPYASLFRPGEVPARSFDLGSIAALYELALGLSAWKEFRGSRWALRCDPSSGNLHPTEGYLLAPALPDLPAGVYHYTSHDHALERRFTPTDPSRWSAALGGALVVGLTSIHWREAWKYGERAFRYCQHDAGHCIATVRYAAATLGWHALLLEAPSDDVRAALLGTDRDADHAAIDPLDREHPDALLAVGPSGSAELNIPVLLEVLKDGAWTGLPNALSPAHMNWDAIDAAARDAWKPATEATSPPPAPAPDVTRVTRAPESDVSRAEPSSKTDVTRVTLSAATLIRQRRSAVQLDGRTTLPVEAFHGMLDALLPRAGVPPWDALPWEPQVHPALLVHRVDGLEPGLYFFERRPGVAELLRAASSEPLEFAPVRGSLYRLSSGDARNASRVISCHQEIAADGAFTLGMLAEFGDSIRARGSWWWRRLFWEAGVLGHVLYLEAEAAGIRGTGIGCYFDDAFHQIFGFTDDRFQSLYHFTCGGPVEDTRIATRPPYAHLNREPGR